MSENEVTAEMLRNFSVLVADDHEYFREWMREELTRSFPSLSAVYETNNAHEAISKAVSLRPELIFMDIEFSKDRSLDGIDAAEQIWSKHPEAAIVITSNHAGEIYVKRLYKITPETGGYGYVLKDSVAEYLNEVVKRMLSGDCWIDPAIRRIENRMAKTNYNVTGNEYEVLVCIALGLNDRSIAQLLCLTNRAIQARLRSLYDRFAIPDKADQNDPNAGVFNPRCRAIWYGFQRGLIDESELKARAIELSKQARDRGLTVEL